MRYLYRCLHNWHLKLWACLLQQSASVILLPVWQGQRWDRPVLLGKDLVAQTVSLWMRVLSCCQSNRDRVETVKTWWLRRLVCECECRHVASQTGTELIWDRKDLVVQTVVQTVSLWVRVFSCCQSDRDRGETDQFYTVKTWRFRRLVCECECSHVASQTGTEVRQTNSTW